MEDKDPKESQPHPDTLRLILDTALYEYKDELDRFKQFDSKTAPMVAATGAVLLFGAGTLSQPPVSLPLFWRGVYFGGVCLMLLVLVFAQVMFLLALSGRSSQRIALNEVLMSEFLALSPGDTKHSLAYKYWRLVADNTAITNKKAEYHKWGLVLLSAGIFLLVLLFAFAGASVGSTP